VHPNDPTETGRRQGVATLHYRNDRTPAVLCDRTANPPNPFDGTEGGTWGRRRSGAPSRSGSFAFFLAVWVSMMAAMMLPGAAPAVMSRAHASGRVRSVPLFVASYLAVWTVVGVAVYALYRPHGTFVAGAVAIAAGAYEFTPLKQHFRRRCRERVRSGFDFGLCCVGSSIGLMLMLVALSVMSVGWMSVIAALVLAQKLLPAKAAIDVPLALAIVGLGLLIIIAPSSVPGLTPPM
jgi:predicted metal-binding membrane protein